MLTAHQFRCDLQFTPGPIRLTMNQTGSARSERNKVAARNYETRDPVRQVEFWKEDT